MIVVSQAKKFTKEATYKISSNSFCTVNSNSLVAKLQGNLNLHTFEAWNSLTANQIRKNGGGTLLKKYTIYEIKCLGFPEGKDKFSKPNKKAEYWNKQENIQIFLSELKEKLNLKNPKDWNLITSKDIINNGGRTILKNHSMLNLKLFGCSSVEENEIKQNSLTYWESKENISNFLSKLEKKLNFKKNEDWNFLTKKHIRDNGGSGLLKKYSLFEIKSFIIFKENLTNDKKSRGFWCKQENIQFFLDNLRDKYSLRTPDDWNSITQLQIKENGGKRLLNLYSMFEIKCMGFPEGKPYFFNPKKSTRFWDQNSNIQDFIFQLQTKFNLITMSDWNRISTAQINSLGGNGLLLKYSKDWIIKRGISTFYENSDISIEIGGRSSQRWLFLQIQKLFPGEEIVEDYFHSEISRKSGFAVQFDVFLVEKKIAFEYHGKQHYEDIPSAFAPIELYAQRDFEKQMLCRESGIQLIVIPYWWDNNLSSLKETINSVLSARELKNVKMYATL